MQPRPDQTISEIVRADYRTADVFKKHNINYCCSGMITLKDACTSNNVPLSVVSSEIIEATRSIHISSSIRFNEWKTDFLIDYIIHLHHDYIFQAISSIELRLMAFIDSHGAKYPETQKILKTFRELTAVLSAHTKEEEEVIFPYVRQIDAALRRKEPYGSLLVRTLRKSLVSNEKEHEVITGLMNKLRKEANDFQVPEGACTSHQVLYHKLREFNDDLVQHTHLENNVLMPRAIAIEKELLEFYG